MSYSQESAKREFLRDLEDQIRRPKLGILTVYKPLSTMYTSGTRGVSGPSCSRTVVLLKPSGFYNSVFRRRNGWHLCKEDPHPKG
jgi:hypothetical protein